MRATSLLVVLWEVLRVWSVHASDDYVITLVWLKRHLINWTELLLAQDLDLVSVDDLWGDSRVDTGSLNCDHKVSSILNEHRGVQTQDSGLIWLGNVSEDNVDHRHEHSILLWVTGILDNWDNICALLGHVYKVTSDTLRELYCVDGTLWSDEVRDVRDGSARGSSDVKNFAAWLHVDVIAATTDACSKL